MTLPAKTALQIKRNGLLRDIHRWVTSQRHHMPHIAWARDANDFTFASITSSIHAPATTSLTQSAPHTKLVSNTIAPAQHNDLTDSANAELIKLWLPSDVPSVARPFVATAEVIEADLQYLLAEMHDCLIAIRRYRRVHLVVRTTFRGNYKKGKTGGPEREKITDIGNKIDAARVRYQSAWHRAAALAPDGNWKLTYQVLERADIRGPNPDDDITDAALARKRKKKSDGTAIGHGTYQQSWIWLVALNGNDEPEDSIRVHWAKTAANAERWSEELEIILEEMRRVLAYFEWYADWWRDQIGHRNAQQEGLQQALDAHARRQEAHYLERVRRFSAAWLPIIASAKIEAPWSDRYRCHVPADAWSMGRSKSNRIGMLHSSTFQGALNLVHVQSTQAQWMTFSS
jgi:hypothetical protein